LKAGLLLLSQFRMGNHSYEKLCSMVQAYTIHVNTKGNMSKDLLKVDTSRQNIFWKVVQFTSYVISMEVETESLHQHFHLVLVEALWHAFMVVNSIQLILFLFFSAEVKVTILHLVFTGLYLGQCLVDTWWELSKTCSSMIACQKVPLKSF
jgi:hypothetical protein